MAHILLIDDDPQILRLYDTFLSMEGHTVVTAQNGKVGLERLAETRFDLVLTDIIMPEKDGLEVLISQMLETSRPKIIVMTGGSPAIDQGNLLTTARLLKADLVLSKPLGLQQLSEAIKKVLPP